MYIAKADFYYIYMIKLYIKILRQFPENGVIILNEIACVHELFGQPSFILTDKLN